MHRDFHLIDFRRQTLRILHASDWHLGHNLEGRPIILLAGDVFDTYNSSADAEEFIF
jgi:DNA repair exonuclease SbcCD nuclease subunit